jgi:hypothetical protein
MSGMGGMGGLGSPEPLISRDTDKPELSRRVKEIEHQIGRLSLLNQALWELLQERMGLSDKDLERRAHDVDLRDGIEDGQISETPLECPRCHRVSSSKHWKCLYCGLNFEKPIMG